MAKIAVIGSGSWGTALTWLLCNNGHELTLWSYLEEERAMFERDHQNSDKLPGVILPDDMIYTCDLEESCKGKDLLVMAVPSNAIRATAKNMAAFTEKDQLIVVVSKGIEEATTFTMSEVIQDEIPQARVAVLSGPSHAEEVGKGLPTVVVTGAKERETTEEIRRIFMSPVFRVYRSPDMVGIEVGAALKNVIALAAGIADGLGYGDNTKAALITRGSAEITRLGLAMGADPRTMAGLAGIGDLIVTCASMHSRNRRAGILIGQGKTMQEAMDEVQQVVEGVYSAKAAKLLADKYGVEMPIVEAINRVLFEDFPAKEAVDTLMQRGDRDELEEWMPD